LLPCLVFLSSLALLSISALLASLVLCPCSPLASFLNGVPPRGEALSCFRRGVVLAVVPASGLSALETDSAGEADLVMPPVGARASLTVFAFRNERRGFFSCISRIVALMSMPASRGEAGGLPPCPVGEWIGEDAGKLALKAGMGLESSFRGVRWASSFSGFSILRI
jgi:hypothetical protein